MNDSLNGSARAFVDSVGQMVQRTAPKAEIVVALSGGPDSTALLLALSLFGGAVFAGRVHAVHVNHNLRAAESDDDELFCKALCQRLSVPFAAVRLDGAVKDEAGLRAARYDALVQYARSINAGCILTGHNENDQVETMLFRLFRGTAPGGLLGMESKRELDAGVSLLRPLLNMSRATIVQFLADAGVQARQDSSNEHVDYARNYIRNIVVPAVEAKFSGFSERLLTYRQTLEADEVFLQTLALQAWQQVLVETDDDGRERWDRLKFLAQPLALKRRILAHSMRQRGIEVNADRIEAVLRLAGGSAGAVTLSALHRVTSSSGQLTWLCEDRHKDIGSETAEARAVQVPGVTLGRGFVGMLSVSLWQSDEPLTSFPQANAYEAIVDLSRVLEVGEASRRLLTGDLSGGAAGDGDCPIVLRLRRPGDVIWPFGMDQRVSLKKYIHTHKRNAAADFAKHSTVVIACANEVLWVPGLGLSERLRVNGTPSHRFNFVRLATEDLTIS